MGFCLLSWFRHETGAAGSRPHTSALRAPSAQDGNNPSVSTQDSTAKRQARVENRPPAVMRPNVVDRDVFTLAKQPMAATLGRGGRSDCPPPTKINRCQRKKHLRRTLKRGLRSLS